MKKLASLILALALVLTSVCAFAEAETVASSPVVSDLTQVVVEGADLVEVVDDEEVNAEIARIEAAIAEGTPISDLFGEEAAVALEGATDVLEMVPLQLANVTGDKAVVTFICPTPFTGTVQCLIGAKNEAGAMVYTPVPTVVNADGSATVTLEGAVLEAAVAGPVLSVFVQL